MPQCGAWSAVGEREDGSILAVPIRCNSWRCHRCARRKRSKIHHALIGQAAPTLLTLTCNTRAHPDPIAAFETMSVAVNHLFKRMRRQWPSQEIAYFLVWERTQRGYPHAHLLLRAPFIPQRWLSAQWRELTSSPIVDIRHINNNEHAANYIAKYLTKDPDAPWKRKRWRSSRNFFNAPALPNLPPGERCTTWTLHPEPLPQLAETYRLLRWVVHGDPTHRIIAEPLHVFIARVDANSRRAT